MSLKRGKSRSTIAHNISLEQRHGKSHQQAVAIALHKARVKRRRKPRKKKT